MADRQQVPVKSHHEEYRVILNISYLALLLNLLSLAYFPTLNAQLMHNAWLPLIFELKVEVEHYSTLSIMIDVP
jgi:hypothetical protein